MNNLLRLALTGDDYTHIRLSIKDGISTNHIFRNKVLSEEEIHYVLDTIIEELEFPELDEPIQVFKQEFGKLSQEDIKVFTVED